MFFLECPDDIIGTKSTQNGVGPFSPCKNRKLPYTVGVIESMTPTVHGSLQGFQYNLHV
jgi:hypothetical protein